jgi:two-component system response regulator AtoC
VPPLTETSLPTVTCGTCARRSEGDRNACHLSCNHRPDVTTAATLIADRFARLGDGTCLDLATGQRSLVGIATIDENDRARLCRDGMRLTGCWHRDLMPFVDYGPLAAGDWFEASACHAAPMPGANAVDARDVAAFLAREGMECVSLMPTPSCRGLVASTLRRASAPLTSCRRAESGIGMRVVERPLVGEIERRLESLDPEMTHVWHVAAPPMSGWQTCWLAIARAARRRGIVPIAASLLGDVPLVPQARPSSWLALLSGRPLLVAIASDWWSARARHRLAALVLLLGAAGNRPVAVLNVTRGNIPPEGADRLMPIDEGALVDAAWWRGPVAGRVIAAAARESAGLPGRFVASLLQHAAQGGASRPTVVHERPTGRTSSLSVASIDAVLARAARSEARGRRAEACRVLRRGAGRLHRRGEARDGLRALAALAGACLRAGRVDEAARQWAEAWHRAQQLGRVDLVMPAGCALATAWILDASLERAATLLTSVIEAARTTGLAAPQAVWLLGECRCWQARWRDARALVAEVDGAPALTIRARAALALGDLAGALEAAAGAEAAARAGGSSAEELVRVLTERLRVDVAAGDTARSTTLLQRFESMAGDVTPGVRAEIQLTLAEAAVFQGMAIPPDLRRAVRRLGSRGHGSLVRARARLAMALAAGGATPALTEEVRRVASRTGARALLPDTAAVPWPWPRVARTGARRAPMVEDVVAILEACHEEADPEVGLRRVVATVATRLDAAGAELALLGPAAGAPVVAGCPPSGSLMARARSMPNGVGPEPSDDGWQAAWPVRQGTETLAVLSVRWRSSRTPPHDAAALGRAASSAIAALVGQIRTRRLEAPPAGDETEILGTSPGMAAVRAAIAQAASAPFHVLIEGESGAGKELVARAIHAGSPRRARRFSALNCAALADDLVEAEMFGHARGAFTGAIGDRPGLFEEADGGTLFLDEVGELTARAQAKLLRAIQEGEIRRLGETRARAVDVRIVSATNRSLARDAAEGRFRADLRFRLDVIRIVVPPLRERPEDVATLASYFWARAAARVGSRATLAPEALGALARYTWPGNVRELQNVLASVAVTAPRQGRLGIEAIPPVIRESPMAGLTLDEARRRFDVEFVRGALARAGGSRSRAASELGLSRQGLAKLLDRLGLASAGDVTA